MPSAKELREQLVPLANQIYQLRDKANDPNCKWTPEDEANFSRLHTEYEVIKANAARADKCEQIEREMSTPVSAATVLPGREDYNGRDQQRSSNKKTSRREQRQARNALTAEQEVTLLQAWARQQRGMPLRKNHIEICQRTGFNPRTPHFDVRLGAWNMQRRAETIMGVRQYRAQSINLQTAGGYTIPQGFVPSLEVALLAYANVRQWADVMRTDSGNDMPWPTTNDTTNKGSILAENTQVTETDVTFGQTVLHAFKYTTALILVPAELLEDSAFNLAQELAMLMGIRLGRIQADHFTTGTGAGQPQGYVTAAQTLSAASATAIAADDLYELKHKVDPWYRPGAMWTFHDQIYKNIKKLKDGLGRYLWQSSLAGEAPDTIDGDAIGINQSMDSTMASGKLTVAYGQMSKYKIRDVNMLRMRRLVERYADYDQEGFVGFFRCDGQLLDAGTHPIYVLKH